MAISPCTITVFTRDSKEFSSFYTALFPGGDMSIDGILVVCEPYSKTFKLVYACVYLLFSIILFSPYFTGVSNPIIAASRYIALFGFGYLTLLILAYSIDGARNMRFLFCGKHLFIQRWRRVFPGHKTIVFNKETVVATYYIRHRNFRTSTTFSIVIENQGANEFIIKDNGEQRTIWLTKLLSGWIATSNFQDLLHSMENQEKVIPYGKHPFEKFLVE